MQYLPLRPTVIVPLPIQLEEQRDQLLQVVVSHEEVQEVHHREAKLKEMHLDLNDKKKQVSSATPLMPLL